MSKVNPSAVAKIRSRGHPMRTLCYSQQVKELSRTNSTTLRMAQDAETCNGIQCSFCNVSSTSTIPICHPRTSTMCPRHSQSRQSRSIGLLSSAMHDSSSTSHSDQANSMHNLDGVAVFGSTRISSFLSSGFPNCEKPREDHEP